MTALSKALADYLALRRSLGFKLKDNERALRKFIAFLRDEGSAFITTQLALDWALQPQHVTQAHRARRLGMVRDFARYLYAIDPRTEIPPQGLLPARPQRAQPYIYTPDQIQMLIREAADLQPHKALRPHTYSALFGLLAVTGMRVGEVVALDHNDVDLSEGVLTVRYGKFNKTRILPIHSSTQQKLHEYMRQRDKRVPIRSSDSFFVSDRGTRLNGWIIRHAFIRVSRRIGLRGPSDSHGPRLHDLRHTFAVRTLSNWHRSDTNPEQQLPMLSAYLGHAKVSDTYWYLSAVPELLGAFSSRLDNYLGDFS